MSATAHLGIYKIERSNDNAVTHNHHDIARGYKLSKEEYEELRKASDELRLIERNTQVFTPILWNYREYYNFLNSYLTAWSKKDYLFVNEWPLHLSVNSHFLNIMASTIAFLNYAETFLKRRYGKKSNEAKTFKNYCSNEYDSNVSYRFLIRLRNYAQHCGFPITITEMITDSVGRFYDTPIASLKIATSRDGLLRDFDGWSAVRKDIEQMDGEININFHLDAMVQSLVNINLKYSQNEFKKVASSAQLIFDMLQKLDYEPAQGSPVIILENQNEGDEIEPIRIIGLPYELAGAVINNNVGSLFEGVEIITFIEEIPLPT